ncbi:MAG: hypothetical protein PHU08_00225 [Dehalococcoidales bacterium]|nr:hypothetical protein [Dehalococcoidales bacterium]
MIIRFEPSGTQVHKGQLKVRLDLYPETGEKSYAQNYVNVPVFPDPAKPLGGYPGKINADGSPVNQKQYDNWVASLPHIWQLNPCLCVFVSVGQDVSKALLTEWVGDLWTPNVLATIDDCMIRANSAHLISPYMNGRNKARTQLSTAKTLSFDEQHKTIVNTLLAGFSISGQAGGTIERVEPGSIDVGAAATDRASSTSISTYTLISIENPANATGTIDTVEVFAAVNVSNGEVAIFYVVSGNNLSTRDTHTIGNFSAGSKVTVSGISDFNVTSGDYIGIHGTAGSIERDSSGSGYWRYSGDSIPCTDLTHDVSTDRTQSLYATGTEAGPTEYNLSVTDGLLIGDTKTAAMTAGVAVTDGLKSGDTTSELGTMATALTDGLEVGDVNSILPLLEILDGLITGDTPVSEMSADASLTDGVSIGDIAQALATMNVQVTDGLTLGDLAVIELAAGIFYLTVTDGLKAGDSPLAEMLSSLTLSDGTKLGDSPLITALANLSLTDGAKIGDTTLGCMLAALTLADGLTIGDATLTNIISAVFNLSVTDGVKLGDSITGLILLKTYLRQAIARMPAERVGLAKMDVNRMRLARLALYRWLTREF